MCGARLCREGCAIARGRAIRHPRADRVDGGELSFFVYGEDGDSWVQCEGRIPDQQLVPFHLVHRAWLKAADQERELARVYGDGWRTPDPGRSYMTDDKSIVRREPWRPESVAMSAFLS